MIQNTLPHIHMTWKRWPDGFIKLLLNFYEHEEQPLFFGLCGISCSCYYYFSFVSVTFSKMGVFWFQPFSWMFSNPINDKSSQSKSYLYQWKCFPTLYLDICAFAEVNKDVNRGRGVAAGGEGEHWSSPKLQKRATAETARTQPGTQTGSAVTLRTATRRINRFPTTSNVSVCCAAWHNNSQSENISHIR